MKTFYTIVVLVCFSLVAYSQSPLQETVGNPPASTSVTSYTGWWRQGITYTGNAEVQNINPSNYNYASAVGNVYFTNTPGTYLEMKGFPNTQADALEINFGMFGYDTANHNIPNELLLSISLDSGLTWSPLNYHRFLYQFYPAKPWDLFDATYMDTLNQLPINVSKLVVRFEQTIATKTFRIDDIVVHFISALPIHLKSFSATALNGKAYLNWNASSTGDKDLFLIEKSKNGRDFSTVGQQYAKGEGEYSYNYVDNFSSNKTFYRLKSINTNGKSFYSKIVMINPASNNNKLIESVFPNPAKDILHVQLNNHSEQKVNLSLVDTKGMLSLQKNFKLSEGISNCELNIQNLKAGVYYLTASTSETKEIQKIVVTK